MNISLSMLIERLEKHRPQTYIASKENICIKSVKQITMNQTLFEPSILYMTNASFFPQIDTYSYPINLLCIADISLPTQCLKNSNLNLIVLDEHNDLLVIFNEVQDIFIEFNQWYLTLIDSLINNKGLQQILNIGYEMIQNPLILFDTSFKVLGNTKFIELDEAQWKETLAKGYFSSELVSKVKSLRCVEKVYKSCFPVLENLANEKYEKMISNIVVNSKIVAHLAVYECSRSFKNSDFEIVYFLCNVISSEMQKMKFFQSTRGIMYEYFIADLLDGKIKELEVIEERIQYLELNLKENLYILTVELNHYNYENTPILQIRDYLENMISSSKTIVYRDSIVMLISSSYRVVGLLEEELKVLKEFLHNNKLYAGFSRRFTSLTEVRKYYLQSLKALELGIRMDKEETFFVYNNYAIYHMMDVHSVETLKDFCHPSLLSLVEYDKKNHTNYIRSLYIYISENKNKASTADLLNIHRHTLDYRIAKIEKIMEIGLDNKELFFDLILSFKILEFINKKSFI